MEVRAVIAWGRRQGELTAKQPEETLGRCGGRDLLHLDQTAGNEDLDICQNSSNCHAQNVCILMYAYIINFVKS